MQYYEPSVEVVDNKEEEDISLLARPYQQRTSTGSSTILNTSNPSNTITIPPSSLEPIIMAQVGDPEPLPSKEVRHEETPKDEERRMTNEVVAEVEPTAAACEEGGDFVLRPAVSLIEEEGQEALWVEQNGGEEEEEDAASLSSSHCKKQPRSSFLFGGGKRGSPKNSKRGFGCSLLNTIKTPPCKPQIVLLEEAHCPGAAAAEAATTAAAAAVVGSSTIKKPTPIDTTPPPEACSEDEGTKKVMVIVTEDDKEEPTTSKNLPVSTAMSATACVAAVAAAASRALQQEEQQPDAVPASDTISSLGFDRSFEDYQQQQQQQQLRSSNNNNFGSPMSMSSLNEILDGPLTPAANATAATTTVPLSGDSNNKEKKGLLRGMFGKKKSSSDAVAFHNKSWKKSKRGETSVQRFVATVVEHDDQGGGGGNNNNNKMDMDLAVLDMDARLRVAIQNAMENDETHSLTSRDGVPVHNNKNDNENDVDDDQHERDGDAGGGGNNRKPVKFDTVKPSFVAPSAGGVQALMSAKGWQDFSLLPDNDDDVIPSSPRSTDTKTENYSAVEQGPVDLDVSYDYDDDDSTLNPHHTPDILQSLPSTSPASTTSSTDRYTVAAETTGRTDTDDDDEEDEADKYSVLPDPCSFCDSLWISASRNQQTVSASLSESPSVSDNNDASSSNNNNDPRMNLDSSNEGEALELENDSSPVLDKYAELPEVLAASGGAAAAASLNGDQAVAAAVQKSSTTRSVSSLSPAKKGGLVAGIFGKLKRTPSKAKSRATKVMTAPAPMSSSSVRSLNNTTTTTPKTAPKTTIAKATPKKSILKERKVVATQNMAPVVVAGPGEGHNSPTPIKPLLASPSLTEPVAMTTSNRKNAPMPSEDASSTTDGSSSVEHEEDDPLVDHIRKQQQRQQQNHRQQRGMDPVTAVEEVVGRLQLDP